MWMPGHSTPNPRPATLQQGHLRRLEAEMEEATFIFCACSWGPMN